MNQPTFSMGARARSLESGSSRHSKKTTSVVVIRFGRKGVAEAQPFEGVQEAVLSEVATHDGIEIT